MAYTKIMNKPFGVPVLEEFKAAAAITPGMLVYKTSTGTEVAKHATAGGSVIPAFALENVMFGKTVADDYATADQLQVWYPRRGDVVIARLKASENVAIGDFVESAGDGTLRKVVADTSAGTIALNSVIGIVEEASNTASVVLIKVRVL